MEARNKLEYELQLEKQRKELELEAEHSKEIRKGIIEEVAKTQAALMEMRHQKPQRKISLSEVKTTTTKPRKSSSSVNHSESSFRNEDHKWEGVKSLTFMMKGEKVKVERLSLIGNNVNGGSVYSGYLPEHNGKLVAISEWPLCFQQVIEII
jgi:sRNA-binding protein